MFGLLRPSEGIFSSCKSKKYDIYIILWHNGTFQFDIFNTAKQIGYSFLFLYIFNIELMNPIKITHLLSIDKQYNFEVEFVLSVAKSFFCTEQDLH